MSSGAREPAGKRSRLAQPAQVTDWVHSAVNLNTGQVLTTELDGPPTLASRAAALPRLGLPIDVPVPGSPPFYRLSVRYPYQASPEAWMSGDGVDGFTPWLEPVSQDGLLQFAPPRDWVPQPGCERGLRFNSRQLPEFRALLLTIPIAGNSWPGATGHVVVGYVEGAHDQGPPAFQAQVPVPSGDTVQIWLDVAYTPGTLLDPEFFLKIGAGVQLVEFTHATLGLPPPIIKP